MYSRLGRELKRELTLRERSVLLGTLLGDAGLQPSATKVTARIGFTHSVKQRGYLVWKISELAPFLEGRSVKEVYTTLKSNGKTYKLVRAYSIKYRVLGDYYRLLYSRPNEECTPHIHKKRFTQEILDMVDDLALAVWFADDGTNDARVRKSDGKGGSLSMCLGGITEEEVRMIVKWFRSKGFSTRADKSIGVQSWKVHFSVEDSQNLTSRISCHLPESMQYKFRNIAPLGTPYIKDPWKFRRHSLEVAHAF